MDAIPDFTRDLLVSLHPRHASNILSGEKTVELRRRFPERHMRGALALIYSTSPVQAIVGVARGFNLGSTSDRWFLPRD
jgi:predicted transcriptional regulator